MTSFKKEFSHGLIEWRNESGQLHREDGPAIEHLEGAKEWWLNGQRHREDGPAIDGKHCKAWWVNGQRHREMGAAIEWTDGSKQWWVNDKQISFHICDGWQFVHVRIR